MRDKEKERVIKLSCKRVFSTDDDVVLANAPPDAGLEGRPGRQAVETGQCILNLFWAEVEIKLREKVSWAGPKMPRDERQ